jgi:hypothetical protein
MLIEIKGYAKPIKHQLEKHMEYDGINKDEITQMENINDVYGYNPCPC